MKKNSRLLQCIFLTLAIAFLLNSCVSQKKVVVDKVQKIKNESQERENELKEELKETRSKHQQQLQQMKED